MAVLAYDGASTEFHEQTSQVSRRRAAERKMFVAGMQQNKFERTW
jgi:hypothetical protein